MTPRLTCLVAAVAALLSGVQWARGETVLFVGNSFTFGALSPVWRYRAGSVRDLNNSGVGGVPALFKLFSDEAGLDMTVSLETSPGKDLQWHLDNRRAVLAGAYDHVVLQTYSTLDAQHPGDPSGLIRSAEAFARLLHDQNPKVDIRITATWSRADLTYQPTGAWYRRPISAMALDVRRACDRAAAASPFIRGVLPVGEAFNRAIDVGVAVRNPYEDTPRGQVDLWAYDNYHASAFGYYLEALIVFGGLTGRDPLSLGPGETAAKELGFSPSQTAALQKIAHDQLAAEAKDGTRARS